jgi:hypothetical protein
MLPLLSIARVYFLILYSFDFICFLLLAQEFLIDLKTRKD